MKAQDLLPDCDAASLVGVAVSTLQRFAEAGYLQIHKDLSGAQLFSKGELAQVFGIKESFLASSVERSVTSDQDSVSKSAKVLKGPAWSPESNGEGSDLFKGGATPTTFEPIFNDLFDAVKHAQSTPRPVADVIEESTVPSNASKEQQEPNISYLEQEVSKLKNVIALQEKLLDMRELELKDLKNERSWLKQRIEKLEDKNDRDQILLLSETQTIRQLLQIQNQRRSPVRLALEWLGLATPPAPTKAGTIELIRG